MSFVKNILSGSIESFTYTSVYSAIEDPNKRFKYHRTPDTAELILVFLKTTRGVFLTLAAEPTPRVYCVSLLSEIRTREWFLLKNRFLYLVFVVVLDSAPGQCAGVLDRISYNGLGILRTHTPAKQNNTCEGKSYKLGIYNLVLFTIEICSEKSQFQSGLAHRLHSRVIYYSPRCGRAVFIRYIIRSMPRN